jgi:16S rRNA (uracil1498-N3)-methyltransferase
MARRRFFVDSVRDGRAELSGEDARHLTRVLRAATGQLYEITDNQQLYLAEISSVAGKHVEFRVVQTLDFAPPPLTITLLAALIKFDRFEWIVEKATELGVTRIVPVNCERTEKGLAAASVKRRERWQKIARESSQQTRRVSVPEIDPAVTFDAAITRPATYRYVLEENPDAPSLLTALPGAQERHQGDSVALATGPEGGWTDGERSRLSGAGWQAVAVGLHILRAETAAIAAVSQVAAAWLP